MEIALKSKVKNIFFLNFETLKQFKVHNVFIKIRINNIKNTNENLASTG